MVRQRHLADHMLSKLRVLVVEAEFLVALDLQRLLEQAHAATTVFARSIAEAAGLPDLATRFDLAIIAAAPDMEPAKTLARRLQGDGVAVVVPSTDGGLSPTIPGLDDIPLLHKPFAEAKLRAACSAALADVPPRD
jgi:DNA-binding response OmpR family regulator